MTRCASWLALALMALLAAGTAQAQPRRVDAPPLASDFDETDVDTHAREAFDAGRAALDAGRPEDALMSFREAYRLSGRPELLYNIGLVEDRLRHDRPARDAFRGYLDAVPDAANRASVEDRLRVLEDEIARDDQLAAVLAQQSGSRDHGDDLLESPVLWVIVGLVVVGAGVGIGLGVGLSQDPGTAPAAPGPSGVVVSALRF